MFFLLLIALGVLATGYGLFRTTRGPQRRRTGPLLMVSGCVLALGAGSAALVADDRTALALLPLGLAVAVMLGTIAYFARRRGRTF